MSQKETYRGYTLVFNAARPAYGPWQARSPASPHVLHATTKQAIIQLINETLDVPAPEPRPVS